MTRNTDRLDMSVDFQPVNIAVMTVSDSRTPDDDRSGDLLASRIAEDGHVWPTAGSSPTTCRRSSRSSRLDRRPEHRCRHSHRRYRPDRPRQHARSVCADRRKGHSRLANCSASCPSPRSAPRRCVARRWRCCRRHLSVRLPDRLPDAATGGTILRYQLDIRHRPCNFVEIMPRLPNPRRFAGPADAGPVDRDPALPGR